MPILSPRGTKTPTTMTIARSRKIRAEPSVGACVVKLTVASLYRRHTYCIEGATIPIRCVEVTDDQNC
jgi:hypothetical protein